MKQVDVNRSFLIVIIFFFFCGCNEKMDYHGKSLVELVTERQQGKGRLICNEFISSNNTHGQVGNIFYPDSIGKVVFLKEWKHLENDFSQTNLKKIRNALKSPEGRLKDYLSGDHKLKVIDYSRDSFLSEYKSRFDGKCGVFYSQPIIVGDSFGIMYEESFCGSSGGGGQINIYYYSNHKWELVGFRPIFLV